MMTDEHKAALERGRAEGRLVREYLEALRATKPKRGRKRTSDTIKARLHAIEQALPDASPIDELKMVQERRDLTTELQNMDTRIDIGKLEDQFVSVAKAYSTRKGISYASWREVGVPAAVLKRADITRAG